MSTLRLRDLAFLAAGQAISTSNLQLHFDAGNAASYPGSGTTIYDISGNGRNGTLINGPTFSASGGGAISFDGVDDYISTTYGPTLADFTVAVWYYSTGSQANAKLVDKSYASGMHIFRSSTSTSWGAGVRQGSSPYGIYLTLPENAWHMLVSRRSGTTHTIFADGTTNTTSGTVSGLALSNTVFNFGSHVSTNPSGTIEPFKGLIAVVMVYDRALTDAEVLQNHNAYKDRFGL